MRNGVALVPAGLLGAGWLLLALAGNPTPVPLGHDLAALPAAAGPLRATTGGVPEALLPYDGSKRFARVYRGDSVQALLVVEYFALSAGTAALRSPLAPLRNGGWSFQPTTVQSMSAGGKAVQVWRAQGQKEGDVVVAYHWIQRRGTVSANAREMRLDLLTDAVIRRRSEVTSVLVLVQSPAPKSATAPPAAVDSAARALAGAVIPALDRLLP